MATHRGLVVVAFAVLAVAAVVTLTNSGGHRTAVPSSLESLPDAAHVPSVAKRVTLSRAKETRKQLLAMSSSRKSSDAVAPNQRWKLDAGFDISSRNDVNRDEKKQILVKLYEKGYCSLDCNMVDKIIADDALVLGIGFRETSGRRLKAACPRMRQSYIRKGIQCSSVSFSNWVFTPNHASAIVTFVYDRMEGRALHPACRGYDQLELSVRVVNGFRRNGDDIVVVMDDVVPERQEDARVLRRLVHACWGETP